MTVYDVIGGADAVAAVVEDFYGRVLADEHLAPWFEGIDLRRLEAHQRAFIAAAVGGPDPYAGRSMADAHAGLGITPEAFALVVDHLTATLVAAGVPDEAIGTIGAALFPLEAQIVSTGTPAAPSEAGPSDTGP